VRPRRRRAALAAVNISRNDFQAFSRAYDTVLGQPRQASLHRRVPIAYVWDDHDFGPNDTDRLAPSRAAARHAYDAFVPTTRWRGPAGGPAPSSSGSTSAGCASSVDRVRSRDTRDRLSSHGR
jgi:hypothetical protein